MRSIRLSLTVYFLGLLGAALVVASLFVYRTAKQTLDAKEQAAAALIEAQYEERAKEARQKLQERLLSQAKVLAGRVRPRYRWNQLASNNARDNPNRLAVLGVLSTHVGPCPHYACLVNLHQATQVRNRFPILTPLQFQLWKRELIDVNLGKDIEGLEDEDRIAYRIDTNGFSQPLESAYARELALPAEADFAPDSRLTWSFDVFRTEVGIEVWRVRFRSRITLQEFGPPGVGPGPSAGSTGSRPPRSDPAAIIIQCAADSRELEKDLTEVREQRDRELASLQGEKEKALAQHRFRLLIICALTFAATILGSLLLVRIGLAPLSRLSEAVSKVSAKNFRLDVDNDRLPSELHPIGDRLSSSLQLLERAFAREKQTTADISHELRTPLAALLINIELALRKPRTPEKYRELFADCKLSADHMHQIVERLLLLARVDAGVDRLRARPVDVCAIAEECATCVRPLAEARGLRLSVYDHSRSPDKGEAASLHTDPDKLREVINNLLHNAVQYNRPDGRIDLTVAREDGQVRFEVSDSGIGIEPEARDHIFERFYRADPARAADDMHAGLGLAIVKEYVDLMGGRITVESQVGQGSTFRVELPVHGPAQAG